MSRSKKLNLGLLIIFVIISFFAVGCENSVAVNDIHFKLDDGKQIVLMVGQTLEMKDRIVITPSYATNRDYTIESFDENVVRIQNNDLFAVSEGVTQIRVVSDDSKLVEDLMTVVVKKNKTTLKTPLNLRYDNNSESFSFDGVAYASSYTLKINGDEYNLGNSTVFNLSQYRGTSYDTKLVVQVKANAPSYTYALEGSEYSDEYKIYQAGELSDIVIKNGVLEVKKSIKDLKINIYLRNTLFVSNAEKTNQIYVSLKELDEFYTNSNIDVKLEAVVTDEIKQKYGDDVEYFNTSLKVVNMNVMDVPEIVFGVGEISWQNIPYASRYEIFVDNVRQAETTNNYFDLTTMVGFDQIFTAGETHNVRVNAVMDQELENVGKSNKDNTIKIKRLSATSPVCEGSNVVWQPVVGALYYVVNLSGKGLDVKLSTTLTSFDMSTYSEGDYIISIQAVGDIVKDDGGNYLMSSQNVSFEFNKLKPVTASIANRELKVSGLISSNQCWARFNEDGLDDVLLIGNGYSATLDLTGMVFSPGEHAITLKTEGDNDSIESDSVVVGFTQLEAIDTINIENGVASVELSEINENATIQFRVAGGTLATSIFITNGNSYTFNTTDPVSENYLEKGEYKIGVLIYGDDSSTFSYRVGESVALCAEEEFTVLSAPQLKVEDTSKTELNISDVENSASYDVFSVVGENSTLFKNVEELVCEFDLENGETKYFAVQSKGDGSSYLDSCISETISVTRLQTPTLKYNSSTGVLSKQDSNNADIVDGYVLKRDGVDVEYDFASKFEMEDSTILTLTTKAIDGSGNTYYLDSLSCDLELTKISNNVNISLNEYNNVVIETVDHDKEYLLFVNIDDGSNNYDFFSKDKKLICETEGIELSYDYDDNKYFINIIENYNTVIENMNDEFTIKIEFAEVSTGDDVMINSEIVSADLSLVSLDSTSEIVVNKDNKIVITPTNINKECGLIVKINGRDDLTFKSDGEKLDSTSCQLDYEYLSGSYYITVLDGVYNAVNNVFNSDFTISVKLTHNINTQDSDLDGDFTENKTITVQEAATLERSNQTLKFNKVTNAIDVDNYKLIVENQDKNKSFEITLTEDMVQEGNGLFIVDVKYIYERVQSEDICDVHSVSVLTLNEVLTPNLARKGEEILIQKAQTLTISSTKDNNNLNNNSVVVGLTTISTEYEDKDYVFEISDQIGGVAANTLVYENSDANKDINFNLDEEAKDLTGTIYVHAFISTSDEYVKDYKTVYVFNSESSNWLSFEKISAPTGLSVSNNILTFNKVENAAGYEIYCKTTGEFEKLNTEGLWTTNSFELQDLASDATIYVKAIAKNNSYTNSTRSELNHVEEITVHPISISSFEVVNGKFKLAVELPSDVVMDYFVNGDHSIVDLIPTFNNGSGEKTLDLAEAILNGEIVVSIQNLTTVEIICEPFLILNYAQDSEETMLKEDVDFKIAVEAIATSEKVFYLNSNVASIEDCQGLFKPYNLAKTVAQDGDNEDIESLTWKNSDYNTSCEAKYIFKIEYTRDEKTNTYYSNDTGLKYMSGDEYKSYDTLITGVSTQFPKGYDEDGDGALNVVFGAGVYRISVQAVPYGALVDEVFCASKFSEPYEFEILEKPGLYVNSGNLSWGSSSAEKYKLYFYEKDGTDPICTAERNITSFDFTTATGDVAGLSGIVRVEVRALAGTKTHLINSEISEPIYIYRLPNDMNVTVDDGYLILETTDMFKAAKIDFLDSDGTPKYSTVYSNPDFESTMNGLYLPFSDGSPDWKTFTSELTGTTFIRINVDEIKGGLDYTLNITLIGSDEDWRIANSSKQEKVSNLNVSKLAPNSYELKEGTIQFKPNEQYATYDPDTYEYLSHVDMNYLFNDGLESGSENFWKTTAIFKIKITHASGETYIYAVDYYSFMTAKKDLQDYEYLEQEQNDLCAYVKYNDIYFNVYKFNTIDLKTNDQIKYYPIEEEFVNGKNTFIGNPNASRIDLTAGVSFVIEVSMLGGDSYTSNGNLVGCLSANSGITHKFVKYSVNTISAKNGKIMFKDLLPKAVNAAGEEEIIDYPVYKIVVQTNGNNNMLSTNTKLFYLYYEDAGEDAAKTVAESDRNNWLETSDTRVIWEHAGYYPVEISVEDLGYLYFDLSQYIGSDIYNVSILTLAGLGNGAADTNNDANYRLNASKEASKTLAKWSDVEVSVVDGKIQFNQSSYTLGNTVKCANYEIKIVGDGEGEFVFCISGSDPNVTINNNIVTYSLPKVLSNGDETYEMEEDKEYDIYVRAISDSAATDNINGTFKNSPKTIKKVKSLENVRIESGVLKWNVAQGESFNGAKLVIKFIDIEYLIVANIDKNIQPDDSGNYCYTFADGQYSLANNSGKITISSDYKYQIEIYQRGDSEFLLDSNVSKIEKEIERLNIVNNIRTERGILYWDEVENATGYEILISGTKEMSAYADSTNFDVNTLDEKLPVGNYSIQIRAVGDDTHISSIKAKGDSSFTQLGKVTSITISGLKLSWGKVENAENYEVKIEYTDGELKTATYEVSSSEEVIEFEIDSSLKFSGDYKIIVMAIGGSNDFKFNGEAYEQEATNSRPNQASGVEYDSEAHEIIVTVNSSDIKIGDKVTLTYDIAAYNAENNPTIKDFNKDNITEKTIQVDQLCTNTSKVNYSFELTTMGYYSSIKVEIVRGDTPSNALTLSDIELDLFSYGGGTGDNEYVIKNTEQLLNIKYYPNSHYLFGSGVNLEITDDIKTTIAENGAIIPVEFKGSIDGASNQLTFVNEIDLEEISNFALFKSLEGATISNLTIAGKGGDEENSIILSNTFAKASPSVINLSLIALVANNSEINDIIVTGYQATCSATATTAPVYYQSVYLGGLFGTTSNTTMKNLTINTSVQVLGNFKLDEGINVGLCVGGVVGYAETTLISDSNIVLNVKSGVKYNYVGGAIAYYQDNSCNAKYGIANTIVEINADGIDVNNFGGLAGYARCVIISDCETSGSYEKDSINYNLSVGGLIGYAQSVKITSSGSVMSFDLTISNTTGSQFIGSLVGQMAIYQSQELVIESCYSEHYNQEAEQTQILNKEITLGIYGSTKNSEMTIENCGKTKTDIKTDME